VVSCSGQYVVPEWPNEINIYASLQSEVMSDAIVDTKVLMIISVGGVKHHELGGEMGDFSQFVYTTF
jgi:hypothetical protein